MAVDMFLEVTGPKVDGEARDKTHAGKIDVLAWSWGVTNMANVHTGGGGGAGKANFQDLNLTTWFDKATPKLMQGCAKGTHFEKMTLITRKAGDKPLEYLKLVMEQCLVTSVQLGGSNGEDRQTANVAIQFAKFKMEYFEQDKKGSGKPAVDFGYNIEENVEA